MNLDDDDSGHKILIIGPPKAGKTTYITRYVHGHYFANEAYKETIGGMFFPVDYVVSLTGTILLVSCIIYLLQSRLPNVFYFLLAKAGTGGPVWAGVDLVLVGIDPVLTRRVLAQRLSTGCTGHNFSVDPEYFDLT